MSGFGQARRAVQGSAERIAWIDAAKGAAVLIIGLNHFSTSFPELARRTWLARDPVGYVSMAELFVFLSGRLAALIYLRGDRDPAERASKLKGRIVQMYLLHLGCVAFVLVLRALRGPDAPAWLLGTGDLCQSLLAGAVLLYSPTLLDVLPLFMMLSCLMLLLADRLRDQRRWPKLLLVSVLVWAAAQLSQSHHDRVHGAIMMPFFNPFAWQLVYLLGALSGLERPPSWRAFLERRRGALLLVLGAALLGMSVLRHSSLHESLWIKAFASRANVGPVRVLGLLCLYGFAAVLWPRGQGAPAPRWLAAFGANSLWIFLCQIVAYYLLSLGFFGSSLGWSPAQRALVLGGLVLSVSVGGLAIGRWRRASL